MERRRNPHAVMFLVVEVAPIHMNRERRLSRPGTGRRRGRGSGRGCRSWSWRRPGGRGVPGPCGGRCPPRAGGWRRNGGRCGRWRASRARHRSSEAGPELRDCKHQRPLSRFRLREPAWVPEVGGRHFTELRAALTRRRSFSRSATDLRTRSSGSIWRGYRGEIRPGRDRRSWGNRERRLRAPRRRDDRPRESSRVRPAGEREGTSAAPPCFRTRE